MLLMYCSHIGLFYYPLTFQISSLFSIYEVLAARDRDVYEPSYFRMFKLSQLVVFKRSYQPNVELLYFLSEGRRAEDIFALKNPTASDGFKPANLGTKGQHATSRPPKPLHLTVTLELSPESGG